MTDRKESDSEERARLRSASRLAAVQALYQMDLSGRGAKAVAEEFLEVRFREEGAERPIVEADEDLFSDILSGVVATQAEIDAAVKGALAKGWTLPRLDATVRAILRCGAYELMKRPDVPARVVGDSARLRRMARASRYCRRARSRTRRLYLFHQPGTTTP